MERRSLASIFAFRLAVTLAGAMAVYAVIELQRSPGLTWAGLAFSHGWHVLVLGVLVYLVLLIGFDRLIGRYLREIRQHLYKVALGRLDLLDLGSRVREIAEIEGSVNLMVRRMRLGAGDADPHRTALALRDLAARMHDKAPDAAEAVANAAEALDTLSDQEVLWPHEGRPLPSTPAACGSASPS